MKKTLLFTFLLLASITSFGQKIRFSDTTNKWEEMGISGYPLDTLNFSYHYAGDTTREGINYKIINGGFGSVSGLYLIREDTVLGKVYAIVLPNFIDTGFDTAEQVLYNYNWHIGDTVVRNMNGYFMHVVSAIDSTLINSIWHRVWHFQTVTSSIGSKPYDIIEGIGCTDNPLFPLSPVNFESITYLMCFSNSSGTPAISPKVGSFFDNSTSCTLGINSFSEQLKPASVIPNPINETSKIVFPSTISSGSVTIVNSIGQQIVNLPFQNTDEIAIGDKIKIPGIYCYRVMDNESGQVFSGKFVNP